MTSPFQMIRNFVGFLRPDTHADQVVPPSGYSAWLTSFTAAAMAFLCVFAMALAMASGRLAERWSDALMRTATIRLSAPPEQLEVQTEAVLKLLITTPGIASSRLVDDTENRKLLTPWFGSDLPIDELPLPQLIEVIEDEQGYDATGLRQRLAAEAPGAVLDDHLRWRRPLIEAAARLKLLGWVSIVLIGSAMAAMVTLAANAALASNEQVIRVLRMIGATDGFIARAFVRRFTLRAFAGATLGALTGMAGVFLLPSTDAAGAFLTGLGFSGYGWLWPLLLPISAAIVAFIATRRATLSKLRELP